MKKVYSSLKITLSVLAVMLLSVQAFFQPGNCNNIECADNITVSCNSAYGPEVTGYPDTPGSGNYSFEYWDEVTGTGCPLVIIRHWTITSGQGTEQLCEQAITISDTTAPVISMLPAIISGCEYVSSADITVNDNCDESPLVTIELVDSVWPQTGPCAPGMYRTQTQGGWGANPNGNNPGVYLAAHFAEAFPNGLTIGCNNTLTLTSATAVRNFLPSGSTPSALPTGNMTNPGGGYNNVLAGQLVAATLSVTFDMTFENFGSATPDLGTLTFTSGTFQGWTVNELLALANQIIGGCSTSYTYSQINAALTSINENFVDGNSNNGSLDCSGPSDCFLQMTYEITATDNCGNSTTSTQSVIYLDETPPSFSDFPSSITVDCDAVPEPITTLIDECFGTLIEVTTTEVMHSGGCLPTIERVMTATDACGNTSEFTQFITVTDNIPPVFMQLPLNLMLNCGDVVPGFLPEITDNCDASPVLTFTETTETVACGMIIHRSWTATDHCANSTTISQTITVIDNDGPEFVDTPSEFVFNCSTGNIETPIVQDNCGVITSLVHSDVFSGEGCSQQITRTWIATDGCGNTGTFTQVITIEDNESPVFINPPSDIDLPCGATPPSIEPVATDNCGSVEIVMTENWQPDPNGCSQLVRAWLATDECGNSSLATQTITFIDNTEPVLSQFPADISGSCTALTAPVVITATDNCDNSVPVLYTQSTSQQGCTTTVLRTWIATDDCGNTKTHVQTITLSDNQPPQFNSPATVTIGCQAVANYNVQVSDACSSVQLTSSDVIISLGCNYDIQRAWTATDACGNSQVFNQLIHVVDNIAPVFTSVPPSFTWQCSGTPFVESAVATDNCDSQVDITMIESVSGIGCTQTITRTYTATDNCGNSAVATQVITITDNVPPVITGVPSNITASCQNFVFPPQPTGVMATDNCDGTPSLVFTELQQPGDCAGEFVVLRFWTATDDCGNSTTAQQTITVTDNLPPVFTATPSDVTVTCGNIPPPYNVTASDNCGGAVTISMIEFTPGGGCPHIFRTWTATDACGNSAQFTQNITILDEEPPVISGIPPFAETTCNDIPPIPEPVVTDNCDNNVAVTYTQTIIGSGCEFTILRTWIAEDDCGNSSVVSQSIMVEDTAPPVFVNAPPSVTVSCNMLGSVAPPAVIDDCAGTILTTFSDLVNGSGCNYDVLRTYTAMDACGNTATATQIIHVTDVTGPVLSGLPLNTTVACGQIPAAPVVTASDACSGAATVSMTQATQGSGCNFQVIRTWTATDACGNITVASRTIFVNDNTAPVLSGIPQDIVLTCGSPVPPAPVITATDNCAGSNLPVQFIEFFESTSCGMIVNRMWMVSDLCGNTATMDQQISIVDTQAPQFINTPASQLNVSCSEIPAASTPGAIDNCSSASVTFEENIIQGTCPYTIEREWTASDACGNTAYFIQHILVTDNEPPVLDGLPMDQEVDCGVQVPWAVVTASDNCMQTIFVTSNEFTETSGCLEILHRTWSATDLCGNTTTAEQLITISDTQAPVFESLQNESVVSCDDLPGVVIPEVSDCHNADITWQEIIQETNCATEFTVTRIFMATDACGNQSSESVVIHVVDTIAPVLSGLPDDMDVTCGLIPVPEVLTASDNCDNEVEVSFTEDITEFTSGTTECVLENANAPFGNVVIWLPGIAGTTVNYTFGAQPGSFVQYEDGTAHVTGQVYNNNNPNKSWIIDIYLHQKRNWDEWSALGRSYKDDLDLAGEHYIDWSYYEMAAGSTLTGSGIFAGSVLTLSHAPASYHYGFQLGMAANNRNDEYGMSGWFLFSGVVNGVNVSGTGDLITETNCCNPQEITRTWTAQDCAGNVTTYTQNIIVDGGGEDMAPQAMMTPGEFNVNDASATEFTVNFRLVQSAQAVIDMYDMNGNMIAVVFSGSVEGDQAYTMRYPKASLHSGMYVFRLRTENTSITDTGVIVKL